MYTITVGKITVVQAPRYVYRRQNYKHNSNFPKTVANLIEPKMWPLCMAGNGGPSVDVRIHSWPGPTVDLLLARANCGCRAIHSQANCRSTVGPPQPGHPQSSHLPPLRPVGKHTPVPPLPNPDPQLIGSGLASSQPWCSLETPGLPALLSHRQTDVELMPPPPLRVQPNPLPKPPDLRLQSHTPGEEVEPGLSLSASSSHSFACLSAI